MKPLIILTLSLAAVASSGALAQGKTRAQVERLKQQHSARQSSGNTVAGNGRSADESN